MEEKVLRGKEVKGKGWKAAVGGHARWAAEPPVQDTRAGRRRGLRAPPPQPPGRKPPRRKKKQPRRTATTITTVQADKHHHQTRKQRAHSPLSAKIPSPGRNPDSAQNKAGKNENDAEINTVAVSTSTILDCSQTDQALSAQLHESLRWDGILDDPAAEKERLQIYKMNRRKRYEFYIQQHLGAEPCPAARHSSVLNHRASSTSSHHTGCKENCSRDLPEEQE
ncbi:protein LIAT1 [Heliangelus exortis]|uniref:protein LIAT1 n=1 Tax=Heliangelus exortis TaxID=472823 RepID=UPI003A91D7AA